MPRRERRVPRSAWVCWGLGAVAIVIAIALWFVPWTAYDSRCSLATRNDPNIRDACADDVAALMPWFVVCVTAAAVLFVAGALIAARGRTGPDEPIGRPVS